MNAFEREALSRVPLAEAVFRLLRHSLEDRFLSDLFERHRGTGSEQKVSFGSVVQLVSDALLKHDGSGRQSFKAAREAGELEATDAAVYGKLRRLRPELSEAFLAEATGRLRELMPEGSSDVPPSLRDFQVFVMDGKKLKKFPKRLKALRPVSGKMLGGKVVAGLLLNEGLVVSMHVSLDGEANDAPLVPALVEDCARRFPGRHLYVGDRQFCDLTIPPLIEEKGHSFLIRYSRKMKFFPERQCEHRDAQGRQVRQAWGWLGSPRDARRKYVRTITLVREGDEDVVLITNLLDEEVYGADPLLELYLARWSIERVFQQLTEVFHLQTLVGSSPQGAVFQFALCSLLYNLVQAVRGYIAEAQARPARSLSTEMIFGDVCDQLTAAALFLSPDRVADMLSPPPSAEETRARLKTLLHGPWSDLWIKCPAKKKSRPQPREPVPGGHSSAWRILQKAKLRPKALR